MKLVIAGLIAGLLLPGASAWADSWKEESGYGRYRGGEHKEKFRDGPCKVERERKHDGSYKEERECKGMRKVPYRHHRGEYEEKYQDGPCKIERELKRDGTYKEKIDCKGHA